MSMKNLLISAADGQIVAFVAERIKADRGTTHSCIRLAERRQNTRNNYRDNDYYDYYSDNLYSCSTDARNSQTQQKKRQHKTKPLLTTSNRQGTKNHNHV
jgi:hypothetical protein